MNDAVLLGCFFIAASLFALAAATSASSAWPVDRISGTAVAVAGCAAAFVAVVLEKQGVIQALPGIVALACATVCSATDAKSGLVYDRVTYPSAMAIGICVCAGGTAASAFGGAAAAAGTILLLWLLSMRRGIGLGDAKLAAILGAAVGPLLALPAIGLAFVFGAATACAGLAAKRLKRRSALPFAPYLATAFAIMLIVKELQG